MRVYPAIDLLGGQAVRLREGKRDQATVYDHEPWAVAQRFASAGARRVHVVDLDGAFAGTRDTANREALERIAGALRAARVGLQVGGGVRTRAAVEGLRDIGVERVVLGTAARRSGGSTRPTCSPSCAACGSIIAPPRRCATRRPRRTRTSARSCGRSAS